MTLWTLLYKILFKLNDKGIKEVSYAEDLLILDKGKFLCTINELVESALGTLLRWTEDNDLGVNFFF